MTKAGWDGRRGKGRVCPSTRMFDRVVARNEELLGFVCDRDVRITLGGEIKASNPIFRSSVNAQSHSSLSLH